MPSPDTGPTARVEARAVLKIIAREIVEDLIAALAEFEAVATALEANDLDVVRWPSGRGCASSVPTRALRPKVDDAGPCIDNEESPLARGGFQQSFGSPLGT